MSNSYYPDDHRATSGWGYQHLWLDYPSYSLGTYITTFLTTAFILFKALEILGYPIWLWLYQALDMAKRVLSHAIHTNPGFASESDGPSSDMSSGGTKVLSSVFGLNNGLLGKGVRGVTGALTKSYTSSAPAGLGNWDNSCYQNSVIQGMASLPSLAEYLSTTTTQYPGLDPDSSTNGALYDMLSRLNDPDNRGRQFMIRGKLKSMNTWQQQDAQEYYSKILDELDIEVQKASNSKRQFGASWLISAKSLSGSSPTTKEGKESNPIGLQSKENGSSTTPLPAITPNPLDGLLAQRVGCIQCGYTEGLSMIPFNCITVPLEGGRNRRYSVHDCLDEYTKLEYIEGVECAKCTLLKTKQTLTKLNFATQLQAVQEALDEDNFDEKTIKACGIAKKNWVKTTKSRQAIISRAPKALVVHVNRSMFDEMTGAQLKNDAPVWYPSMLDLGYWCLGSRPFGAQAPDSAVEEQWPKDPRASMLPEFSTAQELVGTQSQYRLRAAVTHFGSHGNGHYVCYRQQPPAKSTVTEPNADGPEVNGAADIDASSEKWWRFSDENVTEVPEYAALNQNGVFMLFYERIDGSAYSHSTATEVMEPAIVPISEELQTTDEHSADLRAMEWDGHNVLTEAGGNGSIPSPASLHPTAPTSADSESDKVIESNQHLVDPDTLASRASVPISQEPQNTAEMDSGNETMDLGASATPSLISGDDSSLCSVTSSAPTPEPSSFPNQQDVDMSEVDTNGYHTDDPRVQTVDEMDVVPASEEWNLKSFRSSHSPGPHVMRTAGNSPNSGDENRASLRMVSV